MYHLFSLLSPIHLSIIYSRYFSKSELLFIALSLNHSLSLYLSHCHSHFLYVHFSPLCFAMNTGFAVINSVNGSVPSDTWLSYHPEGMILIILFLSLSFSSAFAFDDFYSRCVILFTLSIRHPLCFSLHLR